MPGPRGNDSRISPHPREGLREDMVSSGKISGLQMMIDGYDQYT